MNNNHTIEISKDLEDRDWDNFLRQKSDGHHVQSSLWAQVKSELGWQAVRIKILNSGEITSGAQILMRRLSPFGAIGYVPKGPVTTPGDAAQLALLFQEMLKLAKSHQLRLIAVQPPQMDTGLEEQLNDLGFRNSWLELVPTATIRIDLSVEQTQLLANMKRQTRQNIHRSEREGIRVRQGRSEDMDTFYHIHQKTSLRQNFKPYPQNYFSRMWQVMGGHGNLVNMIAEYEGEAVSSLLIVPFGDSVIAKTLGWSGDHAEKRPNDAVFWGAICWAKDHHYRWFDMEGIHRESAQAILDGASLPEAFRSSPDFFKLGFGGQVLLMPLAYDYVPAPVLNKLYRAIFSSEARKRGIYSSLDRIRRRIG